MRYLTHFRITVLDGGNFITYVKDCTRESQVEAIEGEEVGEKDTWSFKAEELVELRRR